MDEGYNGSEGNIRPRLPITPEILLKLRRVWEGDSMKHDVIMMSAACCLCYFVFLRAGEITVPLEKVYNSRAHLNFEDAAVDNVSNPQMLRFTIKASKMDRPLSTGKPHFCGKNF